MFLSPIKKHANASADLLCDSDFVLLSKICETTPSTVMNVTLCCYVKYLPAGKGNA